MIFSSDDDDSHKWEDSNEETSDEEETSHKKNELNWHESKKSNFSDEVFFEGAIYIVNFKWALMPFIREQFVLPIPG